MTGHQPTDPGPTDPGPSANTSEPAAEAALAGTTRWREARHAQVLALDYARPDPGGQLTGVYTPVPIAHPPAWCGHLESICVDCLPAWSEDHLIAVFRHGPPGATAGCRCPACRPARPSQRGTPATDPEPPPDAGLR